MAAVTICRDFGAQKNSLTLFPQNHTKSKDWEENKLLNTNCVFLHLRSSAYLNICVHLVLLTLHWVFFFNLLAMPYSMWDFSLLKLCPQHWQYGVLTSGPVTREIPLSDFFLVSSSSLKIVSAPQFRFTRKTPSSLFLVAPAHLSHLDQGSLFWISLSSFFFYILF